MIYRKSYSRGYYYTIVIAHRETHFFCIMDKLIRHKSFPLFSYYFTHVYKIYSHIQITTKNLYRENLCFPLAFLSITSEGVRMKG